MGNWFFIVLMGYPLFAIFILLLRYLLLQPYKTKYVILIPTILSILLGFSFLLYSIFNLSF